jgi:hypothetical protein
MGFFICVNPRPIMVLGFDLFELSVRTTALENVFLRSNPAIS